MGGTAGDLVPVLIAASLSATGSDPSLGIGFSALNLHTAAAGDTALAVCSDGHCGATSFSGTLRTQVRSGDTANTVGLQVQASVVGNGLSGESATAAADPFIFIDPLFANASLYHVVVSPGVGNTNPQPVPEPSTAVLMIVGLAALRRVRGAWRRPPHESSVYLKSTGPNVFPTDPES